MTDRMKPIPTRYNGQVYRSRLEARWAVFFDSLRIPFFYEPEGFNLNGISYLPDFYLPDSHQFFEVKGIMTEMDEAKIHGLIDAGYSVTVGYPDGEFKACELSDITTPEGKHEQFFSMEPGGASWLCRCNVCGKYWFTGSEQSWRCQCCGCHEGDHHFSVVMDSYENFRSHHKAWDVARNYPFEKWVREDV